MKTTMLSSLLLLVLVGTAFPAFAQRQVVKESERIGQEGKIFVFKETLHLKPQFYMGQMPLVYEAGKRPSGLYGGMMDLIYWNRFAGWENRFSYNDVLILEKVEAVDSNGKLLAKAELVEVQRERRRIVYHEVHYDSNGIVQFEGVSSYGVGAGFKLEETRIHGTKQQDYFFILPV